jgi:Spy/CpxP family protein refolding chaperone
MKKQVAQILVIATASAFSLAAQGPGRFHDNGGTPAGNAQTSADAIARRVEYLTALLTLTTNQATQASTLFTTAAATVTPIQANLETARTSLRAAVLANNTTQIDQLSTQIGTFTGQITAAQNRAEAAFYALLTPEQRTRYEALGNRGPGGRGR